MDPALPIDRPPQSDAFRNLKLHKNHFFYYPPSSANDISAGAMDLSGISLKSGMIEG